MPLMAWNVPPAEAAVIQKTLSQRLVLQDQLGEVNLVAGVDVGFEDKGKTTRAAVVVLSFPDLQLIETGIGRMPTQFPYIPGFLVLS